MLAVTPDAAGTGGQQLRDLHDEPTSADGTRRRSAQSWASSARCKNS